MNDSGLVCSAVLSPLSHTTALLTILQSGVTQHNQFLSTEVIAPATAETSAELPDVVSSVLGVVYDIMEKDDDDDSVDGEDGIIIFRFQNITTLTYLGKDFCLMSSVFCQTHMIMSPKIKVCYQKVKLTCSC